MPKTKQGSNTRPAQHGKHLVGRTRAAILNAMDVLDNRKKPLSELLADAAEQQPMRFLDMAAKHCPKDIDISLISDLRKEQMTDAELADIIATRARERRELEANTLTEQQVKADNR